MTSVHSSRVDLDAFSVADVDPAGMLAAVVDTPAQWRHALQLGTGWSLEPTGHRSAAVLGMGGSGIAGDVAALAAADSGSLPVVPVKGYRLPEWVHEDTFVVAVSYSGNTEETLACFEAALARRARIVVVTSGGRLSERADELGLPIVRVPAGRQPRASLAYVAAPTLAALQQTGVLPGTFELASIPAHLQAISAAWLPESPLVMNPAKEAAVDLDGRIPVFHGGTPTTAVVAQRAACQVNENAKLPAFAATLPELDHNQIVGWAGRDATLGPFARVDLRSEDEHPQVRRRFEATNGLIGSAFSAAVTHVVAGDTTMKRLAAGVMFVDLVSVYLAFLRGVDPTPVEPIESLKAAIAQARDD